jgi:molybdate transport system substrate-binding protein
MKRKVLAMGMAAMLAMGITACGSGSSDPSQTSAEQQSSTESSAADVSEASSESSPAASSADGSSTSEEAEAVDLTVFAAASMTETLTEIGDMYMADHPEVTVTFNFDSSGTLKTQIQEGATCDLFISAGQKQMDQLDINADPEVNTEGLDFVDADSRFDILENKVTLCVPADNPAGIESFDDMAAALTDGTILMAMGNSDVPVGQYTQKILDFYGLSEEELAAAGVISYGSDVKEVTTQVSEASVDCGVIYCTDAYSAGLTIVDYATADMCGQVIYPAAVLKTSENQEAAQAFLDYLTEDECMAVFEEVGFSPVE